MRSTANLMRVDSTLQAYQLRPLTDLWSDRSDHQISGDLPVLSVCSPTRTLLVEPPLPKLFTKWQFGSWQSTFPERSRNTFEEANKCVSGLLGLGLKYQMRSLNPCEGHVWLDPLNCLKRRWADETIMIGLDIKERDGNSS